ncbi:MAG: hypothetical protein JOY66_12160 [Acetobacteraceae bacterium]|nr:hypothetical protein [Acetobacteraceae bacterium]
MLELFWLSPQAIPDRCRARDKIKWTDASSTGGSGRIAFAGKSAAELNDNELIRAFYLGA